MKIFEPGRIGNLVLKNRIVMAPMGTAGLLDIDGGFSRRVIDYYTARAAGGAGLIITGCCFVDMTVDSNLGSIGECRIDSFACLSRLSELCDAVHHYGARIAVQLSPGPGRILGAAKGQPPPVSASEVPCFWTPRVMTRQLALEEIERLVAAYAMSARIVKAAGADAIAIHGYGGYLMDQFQTAAWNKRTDKYGGGLEGRLRFSMEIVNAARKAAGRDLPLVYKISADHYWEGGRGLDEGLDMAKRLEAAGIDALHVTGGCYESWNRSMPCAYEPPACHLHLSRAVKEVVAIPVIADGKLGDPRIAEEAINGGRADFISLGRPLLADPEWPRKVRLGQLEDIRPCIGDLDGCIGRILEAKYLSCSVNPITGMEREYSLAPAAKPKAVLVIGGGPAGLEAARVAALRGHKVTLWEKDRRLGGNLVAASAADFKRDIRPLIDYLTTQVIKLGVKVELGREATDRLVLEADPDAVIVATGASPLVPDLPGVRQDRVFTAIDLLRGKRAAGDTVTVVGGGMVGCETAVYLARQGKKVTLVEMMRQLMPEQVNPSSRMGLMDLIDKSGVTVLVGTKLVEVTGQSVVLQSKESGQELRADSVVLALGLRPDPTLQDRLQGRVGDLFVVGDCVAPRKVMNAVWEGFHASRIL